MSVDYQPRAVEARLRAASDATDLHRDRRLHAKIDYSPQAIERRLREVDRARRACLELQAIGAAGGDSPARTPGGQTE